MQKLGQKIWYRVSRENPLPREVGKGHLRGGLPTGLGIPRQRMRRKVTQTSQGRVWFFRSKGIG